MRWWQEDNAWAVWGGRWSTDEHSGLLDLRVGGADGRGNYPVSPPGRKMLVNRQRWRRQEGGVSLSSGGRGVQVTR